MYVQLLPLQGLIASKDTPERGRLMGCGCLRLGLVEPVTDFIPPFIFKLNAGDLNLNLNLIFRLNAGELDIAARFCGSWLKIPGISTKPSRKALL